MFVSVSVVLSGRGLWDELIIRPEESYQLRCVILCDTETPRMRRPWPTLGCCAKGKKIKLDTVTTVDLIGLHNFS